MHVARWILGIVLASAVTGTAGAQTHSLIDLPQPNDCYRVQLSMRLTGEMKVVQEGKPVALKLAATAEHHFAERISVVLPTGLVGKAARYYETAVSSITVDGTVAKHELRPERRLTVAQRPNDMPLCYCPAGPLTREELELVSEHFDTLSLSGLLPGKAVAVGETWKVGNAAVQGLCSFEGLVSQDLTGKLESVQSGVAVVQITGTAKGIELGAQATLTIAATAKYDVNAKCLVELEWKQKDDRDQGPASPAIAAEAVTVLKRQRTEMPRELSDVNLVGVPPGYDVPVTLTQIYLRDPKDHFDLAAGRDWQVVGQTPEHLIMRLLERGDFIAQVTVTPWSRAEPGKHLAPQDLKEAVLKTPGWEAEEILQEGEVPAENGRWVYRVTARGVMDEVKVVQTFYLVAGPKGDQVVLAFTMKQAMAAKLGARDLSLVESIDFPASRTEKKD